ncbi:hypothetical protein BGX30_008594, partial [Mortierella sp. GBA39]
VPVIPTAMQEALKCPVEDVPDLEMTKLREELAELFPDHSATIGQQRDYGVLVFLKSVTRKGPTIHLGKFIKLVADDDKYKPFFHPEHPPGNLVQEGSDASDAEYFPTPSVPQERVPWQRIMVRRSGHYTMDVPTEEPLSQECVSSQEAITSQEKSLPQTDIPPQVASSSQSSTSTTAKTTIPADDMMSLLGHYGTTYRNQHKALEDKEAMHLRALEIRVLQDIE